MNVISVKDPLQRMLILKPYTFPSFSTFSGFISIQVMMAEAPADQECDKHKEHDCDEPPEVHLQG